jgi:hypothetical protein
MERPVRVQRREDRIAKFLESYHSILDYEVHNNFQEDLMDEWEWWKWNGNQRKNK